MEDLDGEGRPLHARRVFKGDLLGDEGTLLAHPLGQVDDHTLRLHELSDAATEADDHLGGDDQEDVVGLGKDGIIAGCTKGGGEQLGGKVLGVASILVDVGHDIRFDGVEDDGVGAVPGESFGDRGAEDPRSGDDYRLVMVHGASLRMCG